MYIYFILCFILVLSLLFKLINYVPHGILEMIEMFENFILSEGLAVINASADIITQVNVLNSSLFSKNEILSFIIFLMYVCYS